jgi:uncharacterized protein YaiI (UPF0178 family)
VLILYVDADACPVKEEIVKVAERHRLTAYFVSGQGLRPYRLPHLHTVMVGDGFDAADNWIAERAEKDDIVITADILLAGRCLKREARVLGPTGKAFTAQTIGAATAMRELNQYLREAGEIKGHNPSFSRQDRSRFLQMLEETVQSIKRTLP